MEKQIIVAASRRFTRSWMRRIGLLLLVPDNSQSSSRGMPSSLNACRAESRCQVCPRFNLSGMCPVCTPVRVPSPLPTLLQLTENMMVIYGYLVKS